MAGVSLDSVWSGYTRSTGWRDDPLREGRIKYSGNQTPRSGNDGARPELGPTRPESTRWFPLQGTAELIPYRRYK